MAANLALRVDRDADKFDHAFRLAFSQTKRGGMTGSMYRITYSSGTIITVSVYIKPDGKIEQFLITSKS